MRPAPKLPSSMLRACTTRSGIWQRSWITSGSSAPTRRLSGRAVPLWIPAGSHLDGIGLLPFSPRLRATADRVRAHPPGLGGMGHGTRWLRRGALRHRGAAVAKSGMVIGRAERHPHGFVSGPEPMYLLSMQLPRPAEGATSWDEPGTTTDPAPCGKTGAPCRRCSRCGGHSAPGPTGAFRCENCSFTF